MELLGYLLKVSACMALFFAFYLVVLRRLTFFSINRFFLLAGLVLSFVIPSLKLTVERQLKELPLVEHSQQMLELGGVSQSDEIYLDTAQPGLSVEEVPTDWWKIASNAYLLIFAFVLGLTVWRLVKLWRLVQAGYQKVDGLKIIESNHELNNCSFFSYVFINEQSLSKSTREILLKHEAVHAKKLHSIDKLVMMLAKAILWFNPIVYFYEKALEQTHEYEADEATSEIFGQQTYAKLLVQLASSSSQIPLVHNFVKSPIKERIKMLFNDKSKSKKKLVYLLSLPVALILIGFFAIEVVYAQAPSSSKQQHEEKLTIHELKKSPGTSLKFREMVKRTKQLSDKVLTGKIGVNYEIKRGHKLSKGKLFLMGNETFLLPNYKNQNLYNLKEGDLVSLKADLTMVDSKNAYISIFPKYIKKDGKVVFTRPQLAATAFRYEGNNVKFINPVIRSIKKLPDGVKFELTRDGYNFNVKFSRAQADNEDYLKSLTSGDTVRLTFFNEIKTGPNSYDIKDWVYLSKDAAGVGLKNKTLFSKFYNSDGSQKPIKYEPPSHNALEKPVLIKSTSAVVDTKTQVSYITKGLMMIGKIRLEAEEMIFDRRNEMVTAKKAQMTGEDGVTIEAELIVYDANTGKFRTEGIDYGSKTKLKSSELMSGLKYYAQDSVRISKSAGTTALYGTAQVEFEGYKIEGSPIEINSKSRIISAHGAMLTTPGGKITRADLIRFNSATKTYTDWKKVLK